MDLGTCTCMYMFTCIWEALIYRGLCTIVQSLPAISVSVVSLVTTLMNIQLLYMTNHSTGVLFHKLTHIKTDLEHWQLP